MCWDWFYLHDLGAVLKNLQEKDHFQLRLMDRPALCSALALDVCGTQDTSSSRDPKLKWMYWPFRWKKYNQCAYSTAYSHFWVCLGRGWGIAGAAVLFSRSQLEYPPPCPCLAHAAVLLTWSKWSFLYSREVTAAKMGIALSSLPVGEKVATENMLLLQHRTLPLGPGSFSSSMLEGLWRNMRKC